MRRPVARRLVSPVARRGGGTGPGKDTPPACTRREPRRSPERRPPASRSPGPQSSPNEVSRTRRTGPPRGRPLAVRTGVLRLCNTCISRICSEKAHVLTGGDRGMRPPAGWACIYGPGETWNADRGGAGTGPPGGPGDGGARVARDVCGPGRTDAAAGADGVSRVSRGTKSGEGVTPEKADVFAAFPHRCPGCRTATWHPDLCAVCRWVMARWLDQWRRWEREEEDMCRMTRTS